MLCELERANISYGYSEHRAKIPFIQIKGQVRYSWCCSPPEDYSSPLHPPHRNSNVQMQNLLPSFLTALTKAALNGFVINSTSPSLLQTLQWSEQVCAAPESRKQHIAKAKTGNTQCSPATVSTGPVSPGKGQTKSCLCKWPGP